jgi:hypothetical protein
LRPFLGNVSLENYDLAQNSYHIRNQREKLSRFIYVLNNSEKKFFFEKIPVLPLRDGLVNNDNFFDNSANP